MCLDGSGRLPRSAASFDVFEIRVPEEIGESLSAPSGAAVGKYFEEIDTAIGGEDPGVTAEKRGGKEGRAPILDPGRVAIPNHIVESQVFETCEDQFGLGAKLSIKTIPDRPVGPQRNQPRFRVELRSFPQPDVPNKRIRG